ncbi:HEPN family nuclease [Pseudomonas fluorescens]|uniref:HEPN family nuclease n=1 Tax=Pseudomonas fluorescens TaxID=294 RepID=UPI003C271DA8
MELQNYPLEFVERTVSLIESLSADAESRGLEVTFLLNCLLGLIVATSENIARCEIKALDKKILELDSKCLIPKKIAYIDLANALKGYKKEINDKSLINQGDKVISFESKVCVNGYDQARNMKLKELLKKIRNGVAHQNLAPLNSDGKWAGVKIWNHSKEGIKDFEIEFEVAELRAFSIFLASIYVDELKANFKG